MDPANPIFCQRCSAQLTPGRGDFYVIRVEAFADPSPPVITDADLAVDHRKAMADLIAQMEGMSERELMDMVHRKMCFFLCGPCYRQWIENPAA